MTWTMAWPVTGRLTELLVCGREEWWTRTLLDPAVCFTGVDCCPFSPANLLFEQVETFVFDFSGQLQRG